MSIKGIDIYNGTRESGLDLARVKAGGIQYAIVKATEGVNYTVKQTLNNNCGE